MRHGETHVRLQALYKSILSRQTDYLRSVLQENITGGKINGIDCSAFADHRFGCSQTLLVCTIQVHPSARLLVDWIWSGLGGGGGWLGRRGVSGLGGGGAHLHSTWFHTGLGWAEIHCTPASFVQHIEHNCTLNRSDVTCCTPDFFCREHWGICQRVANTLWHPLTNLLEGCQFPLAPYNKFSRGLLIPLTTCNKSAWGLSTISDTFARGLP